MKWWFGKGGRRKSFPFYVTVWVGRGRRSLRSDAALEAIAKASEDRVPDIVLYNYPSFSGAFSALFAHLFHTRHNLPFLILPFSAVPSLAFSSTLCALHHFELETMRWGAAKFWFLNYPFMNLLYICDNRVEDLCTNGLETCYLLDFIPPKEFLFDLSCKSKCKIIGFDHRKSVLRDIPPANVCPENIMINVNLEKSSSRAVYEYFTGKHVDVNISDDEAPCLVDSKDKGRVELILKYIEDGDLRRWSLPDIRMFNIGLSEWRSSEHDMTNTNSEFSITLVTVPYTNITCRSTIYYVASLLYKTWLLELSAEDLIAKGYSYCSARQNAASKLLEKVFRVRLGRGFYGECLGVRADKNSNLSDEIGKLLSVKSAASGLRPIGAVIFMQRDNLKMCLRTTDTATDTSEVAKAYGGGGSPSSSSFMIRMDEYNQWITGNSS
ncbi:hypothetical protein LR48_Vigan01g076300 [Vigna angularis]|uniref:Uncharacterized protein n=1 Tax=Phaseolus angularis TaxID=3914 RepID=A0A0L9TKU3_PHAAN|nr:hypothetical protein LR48_Vigan01g076300 [Vigna angularis]